MDRKPPYQGTIEARKYMNRTAFAIVAILLTAALAVGLLFDQDEQVDFSTQIKPIINKRCISCHGGVKKNGGFSLLFENEALAETESGKPAIVPGDAGASELIRRLHEHDPELRMPYEQPKLSDEEIDLLTRWIDQGAEWGEHWAYSLPETVNVPPVAEEAGFEMETAGTFAQNGVDHFILARMKETGLSPNPPAEPSLLARRVALDITGLPPQKSFLLDFEEGRLSYENLVDSLLAQPTYGEKWASWWLDMARYADSKGYEKDAGRSIWHYRDWVIKALNQDMPFDRFTIEQLAGDLLPNPSTDQLIATAFHRNTMNNDEGGTEDEEFRVAAVIDRLNTTFSVWQSTTMECVQCHSHPYDPFKHEEYFQLMAFFNNTRDEDTPDESPTLKFFGSGQQGEVDRIRDWVGRYGDGNTLRAYQDFMRYTEPVYKAHTLTDFVNGSYDDHASSILWADGSCRLPDAFTQGAHSVYLKYNSRFNGSVVTFRERDDQGRVLARFTIDQTNGSVIGKFPFAKVNEKMDLHISVDNAKAPKKANALHIYWIAFLPELPGSTEIGYTDISNSLVRVLNTQTTTVPIMSENPEYMKRTTQVFDRGSWLTKGDTVAPGVPEALNPWDNAWPGNRLGLAQWIVDERNPLTARTLVNRVWHQIYGRGLVTSLEDIGSQSEAPSHPALLDWLALRFMNEHQWSVKSLVRELVLSGTYRQSSKSSPDHYRKDPENRFYAHGPRQRLSAEQIRDQALAVSGLLSDKMYGPGVMPPQPDGVWQTVYNNSQWVESEGEDKYRRAVYTYLKRTSPYPSFLTFDAGSREVCTIRRTVTNTPLQALVTLNDPVYLEAAYALAKQVYQDDATRESIDAAYKKATCSPIDEATLETLMTLYGESLAEFESNPDSYALFLGFDERPTATLAALTVVANAIMNLDEFLTKT